MTKFDPIKSSYQIMFVSMLQIRNLRYSRYFLLSKCVDLESIIFAINLDATSSSKVCSTFDCVSDCIANPNK